MPSVKAKKEEFFYMNKTFLQWAGVFLSFATILIAVGAFKSDVTTMQGGFDKHCTQQENRELKIDEVLNNIAISAERLTVHIEIMTKTIDELKTEIKKKK